MSRLRQLGLLMLFLSGGLLGLTACEESTRQPDDLIAESVYLDLLTELYLSMQWVDLRELYEQEDSLRTLIFDHYEVTDDQFRRSHRYYQRDVASQRIRLDSLRARYDREELRLNEHRARQ